MTTTYGYARVSSKDQNEDRQILDLLEHGVERKNIYIDKQSGKDFDRPAYKKLVRKMKCTDLMYVKSIDRLGRNYSEIIEQWRVLTKNKKVDIKVIDMPLLDTTYAKDLLGTFVSDLVLQVLSFTSESERENIRQRQAEGIAAARLRGVHLGRPRTVIPESFPEIYKKWRTGELTPKDARELSGLNYHTFYKAARELTDQYNSLQSDSIK